MKKLQNKKILITGVLGFIGYNLAIKLINLGFNVVGIDNINSYYDVRLKYSKLPLLGINENHIWQDEMYLSSKYKNFKFQKTDIKDRYQIEQLIDKEEIEIICNLAAQAGVQYSINKPHSYIENNITGFINLLDAANKYNIEHFVYASSSSVYGNRTDAPFKETDNVDTPISLYAASKKSNELMAYTYNYLHNIKTTGLRFFTVYGPWGRPDMAPFIFVKNIIENKPINVFNNGDMIRDFTYIDDIVAGITSIITTDIKPKTYNIYNIGNSTPINLNDFIKTIEQILNKKANIIYKPIRQGDVIITSSDITKIQTDYNYNPKTNINKGLKEFINWYKKYY